MALAASCDNARFNRQICHYLIHMKDPLETAELLSFTRTVESKSLSRAASELGVPRATISRRLARLEARLRVRLLKRTTRRLTVTDAGEAFYAHAKRALEAVQQAEESLSQREGEVRGELRVSVPPLASGQLRSHIAKFVARYPEVRLSIQFSSGYADLLSGACDVALRASPRLEPGLVARTVARSRLACIASPSYLAANGTPKTPADLKRHRCLMGFARGEIPDTEWPLEDGSRVRLSGSFFSNDLAMLLEAARQGLGLALLPDLVAEPDLKSGALVQVLEGVVGTESRVSIVYAERAFLPPQVRAFVDELSSWVASDLIGREIEPPKQSLATSAKSVEKKPGRTPRKPPTKRMKRAPSSA